MESTLLTSHRWLTFSVEHILLQVLALLRVRLSDVNCRRLRQQVLRHTHRMILQVAADRQVQFHGNSQLSEVLLRTYAGQHQYPRWLYGPGWQDNFVACLHLELVSILGHFYSCCSVAFDCYLRSKWQTTSPNHSNLSWPIVCCCREAARCHVLLCS